MEEKKGNLYDDDYPAPVPVWWWRWASEDLVGNVEGLSSDFLAVAGTVMVDEAIRKGAKIARGDISSLSGAGCHLAIRNKLAEWEARLIFVSHGEKNDEVWLWRYGVICVNAAYDPDSDGDEFVEFRMISLREKDLTELEDILAAHPSRPFHSPQPEGQAYVLCDVPLHGIELISIGLAGQDLIRKNYAADVLCQFDRAIEDLRSNNPRGRLIILDGPPGTGKTFMVRAFMSAVPESKFVVVPPHLVSKLADPNLILTFIREINAGTGAPLVLILEDADQCLSKRKAQNIESISSILNLSDGIIGSLLDLRILATTNTPAQEFDEALLRKGRMSSHIKIGYLSRDEATGVWENLVGPRRKFELNDDIVLADVYAAYNELSDVEKALTDIDKLNAKIN
jgi:hypothetical protein